MRGRSKLPASLAALGLFLTVPTTAQPLPKGFVPLFDGMSLRGWRGDPTVWSVKDGAIRASTDKAIASNTFLIHDRKYKDFEIRLKYRFVKNAGNSGLQFRSGQAEGNFVLAGLQANIIPHPDDCVGARCATQRFGMLTDELNRLELVMLGEQGVITRRRREGSGGIQIVRTVTGHTNPTEDILKAVNRDGEWNEMVVIAYGGRIVNAVNNVVIFDAQDNDPVSPSEGLIGLQVNADRAVDVQFKDMAIKLLDRLPDIQGRFVYRASKLAEPSITLRNLQFSGETP